MTRPIRIVLGIIFITTMLSALILIKSFQANADTPKTVNVCGSESYQLIVNGGVHKVNKDVLICK